MNYCETDNPRVLDFRFRTDKVTNAALAAELRRRADALEVADTRLPDMAAIERAMTLVTSRTTGYDEWQRARLVRYIAATGESLWHACWVLFGTKDGRGCDCAKCK